MLRHELFVYIPKCPGQAAIPTHTSLQVVSVTASIQMYTTCLLEEHNKCGPKLSELNLQYEDVITN